MSAAGYPGTELEALAQAPNYYRWIISHFRPWLGGLVLELGAGTGTFAAHLLQEKAVRSLRLVEPADNLVAALRARFGEDERVRVFAGYLEDTDVSEPLDAVVMVNVLEHIGDDTGTIERVHSMLRPGGALLIFVPALSWLYGSLDAAFCHHRRYSRRRLIELLEAAGFRPERLRYMNLPGILSWLLAGRLLRLGTIRPGAMRAYDRLVVPLARSVEDRIAPPVGQNLLAVGVKPAAKAAAATKAEEERP